MWGPTFTAEQKQEAQKGVKLTGPLLTGNRITLGVNDENRSGESGGGTARGDSLPERGRSKNHLGDKSFKKLNRQIQLGRSAGTA